MFVSISTYMSEKEKGSMIKSKLMDGTLSE